MLNKRSDIIAVALSMIVNVNNVFPLYAREELNKLKIKFQALHTQVIT